MFLHVQCIARTNGHIHIPRNLKDQSHLSGVRLLFQTSGLSGRTADSNTHRIHGKWYIYLHEWLIFMVNVGEYTSPMDPMGNIPLEHTPERPPNQQSK